MLGGTGHPLGPDPGQEAARAAVDTAPLVRRPQVTAELLGFKGLTRKDPKAMDDAEKDQVVHANAHLDAQFRPGQNFRKVIPERTRANMVSGTWDSQIAGSVGDARNTQGLTAPQAIEALGLDYDDTSYVDKDPATGQFSPKKEALFLEGKITREMKKKAKIPIDKALRERAQVLAQGGDAAAQQVLDSSMEQNAPRDPVTGAKDTMNPFTGTGATATGDRLPGGTQTINQERMIDRSDPYRLRRGTTINRMNDQGDVEQLHELVQNRDALGRFSPGTHWE
jgi:hypothetical protein